MELQLNKRKKIIYIPFRLRIFTTCLKAATLASKFLLVFTLAGLLDPTDLGLYGLITVTIAYAVFPLGFDFYTYTARELLKHERLEWGKLLKDQAVLHLILYTLVLPFLLLLFELDLLPWHLAGWFFMLLILEHINQELIRLLIAMSEQLTASIVLFIRSGGWAIAISVLMFVEPDTRSFESVLVSWSIGGILAFFLAVYRINCLQLSRWSEKINWGWILKGLKVAVPFVVATLALRAILTIDRFWFEELQGLETLGAYVLFIGISGALISFLDAGVFSFNYPILIAAHSRGDFLGFKTCLKQIFWLTILLTSSFTITTMLVVEPLLMLINKPIYMEHIWLFPWLLATTVLYVLSMIPHYALYAQEMDAPIIYSHLAALFVFVATTWAFSVKFPDLAVLLGLTMAFALLLTVKTWSFYLLTPKKYR